MTAVKGYPSTLLYGANSVVSLLAAFIPGLHLTSREAAAVATVATAAFGLVVALRTRPVQVSAITAFFGTAAVAAGAFGLHLAPAQIATLTTIVSLLVGILTHQSVVPVSGSPAAPAVAPVAPAGR